MAGYMTIKRKTEMKKKTTLALGAAVALSLAVPSIGFAANAAKDESRSVKDFTDISLMGSLDLDVTVGKKTSVKVIAPDDLIDKIITEDKGDTLKVRYEKHMKWNRAWNNKEIRVEVTMPDLKAASLLGSGDLNVTGGKGKAFDLALKGSGDATVTKSDYGSVEISLMGSGDISIDGQCDSISV
ncbi:MAG: DUF2807 domain-containing protein, partial [Bacteroidales bacterium]|nr:DUF2807 domain-containing protein [Bacteroidales bacterium]